MDLPMKAWVIAHNGAPAKALSLRTVSAPRPPRRAEVLVRVTHAALNPADHAYLKVIPSWLPNRWGAATGLDFAGEVVAAGPDVPAGSPAGKGAKVCGALSVPLVFWGAGSLAEYVTVPAALVVPQPEGWGGARSAGGFGVASQTAYIMVKAAGGRGRLGPGARVMVIGASGGVGSVLVQVASNLGAEVVGVCSAGNHEMVQKLGAAEMVDYTAHNPLPAYLAQEYGSRQFDFIFDCVGSHHIYVGSPAYLKPEGAFINIAGDPANAIGIMAGLFLPRFLGGVPRRYKMLALSPSGDNAREVAKWVQDGLLKEILIDSEYSMDDAVKAMDRVGSKRSKGKVVVRVAE